MIKTLAYLFCHLIYPFSFLFRRKPKRWVFGSFRGAFNDNSKYLFIYVSQHFADIDAVWLSMNKSTVALVRSKGLKSYYTLSFKGLFYALKSKFWFYNSYTSDILFCFSGGATCVNLWHGVGLKRIEFNITDGVLAKRYVRKTFGERFYHPEVYRCPDYFLSSTAFQTLMFAKAFRISESQCLEFGYPRNEILLSQHSDRMEFINSFEPVDTKIVIDKISNYDKTFIYMPTWRDSQRNIFENMDLQQLNKVLQAQNQLLILKPHANTHVDAAMMSDLSNVILLPSTIDTYVILPYTDVLITDYSSVLYDYILLPHKDVILYLYDYEDYVRERDFNYPFDENVVGKKVSSFTELLTTISTNNFAIDEAQKSALLVKFWGNNYSNSSEQIAKYFYSKL